MPTIITTPVFSTLFSLNTSPKQFLLSDGTNYGAAGIPLSGVRGDFTITSPSNVIVYNNTSFGAGSDIVANVSLNNAIVIPLPNLSNQAPEQGKYIITYTVQIIDGVHSTYYITSTQTFNFVYTSPVVCITEQVDCISPLFTTTDITNYVVNSITPVLSRTMTLQYPANSGGTSITNTTSATITTSTFYTGMQSVTVSSALLYTISPTFYIQDLVVGTRSINVDCTFICQLVCCLNSLNNRLEGARGVNQIMFEELNDQFNQAMSKVGLLLTNIGCGKQQTANQIIQEIKILSNCTNDCTCTDGTPSKVTGLGNINNVNVIVQSGNAAIIVSSNVSGGVTTYTLTFSQALINIINASYNTVVQNTDGSITVAASGIIGNVQTYTISSNYTPTNEQWFLCSLSNGGASVTSGLSEFKLIGSNMQNASISEAGTLNGTNLFTINNFQVTPNATYKVWVQQIEQGSSTQYLIPKIFDVRVANITSGSFKFQLTNLSGSPLTDTQILSIINGSPTNSILLFILIKE